MQFSGESDFYSRFFAEIFLYLRQYQPSQSWRGVLIYPTRRVDIGETGHYTELLESARITRIYLDELEENPESIGISLLRLVVSPEEIAITQARALVRRSKEEMEEGIPQREILDLVETIIVYKLPGLSREEIQEMLGFTEVDLKQTRFYQDVHGEGRQEEAFELVLRLLNRRFGELDSNLVEQIQALGVSELEALAEALLDFATVADLESWFKLPRLSREEIQEMLGFTEVDLKQTRFYQDVYAEAEANLVLRLLNRRFGELDSNLVEQIQALGVSELEALAEALLDFATVADLESWLQDSSGELN